MPQKKLATMHKTPARRQVIPKARELSPLDIGLDPDNPRLSSEERGSSQDQLREIMIRRFKIDELGASVAASGFIDLDPLIGYEEDGRVVVREGNRRVAALQLLLQPDLAPPKYRKRWELLQAELGRAGKVGIERVRILLYPSRDEVSLESYIGFRHVNGVLEWPAAEKARFIVDMVDRHGWTYEEIAERIGSYPKHVERHYVASRLMAEAQAEGIGGADRIRIGVLLRALQTAGISEFLGITYTGNPKDAEAPVPGGKRDDFVFFVSGTFGTEERDPILPESRELTKWGQILQSPDAVRYLRSSKYPSFERAWIKSGGQKESVVDLLNTAADNLEDCLPLLADFRDDAEVKDAVRRCARRIRQVLRDFPDAREDAADADRSA
jgi:hypothetical protein